MDYMQTHEVVPKFCVCVSNWLIKINKCCKFEVKPIPISGVMIISIYKRFLWKTNFLQHL